MGKPRLILPMHQQIRRPNPLLILPIRPPLPPILWAHVKTTQIPSSSRTKNRAAPKLPSSDRKGGRASAEVDDASKMSVPRSVSQSANNLHQLVQNLHKQ